VHKFHQVVGESSKSQIMARMSGETLQIMARAPVDSFLSGNTNRDAHMLEVIDGHAYPMVTVRAVAKVSHSPKTGEDLKITFDTEVDFHGVITRPKMTATLHRIDDDHISAIFKIEDSIEGHKIERPKLLFVAVDDLLCISGDLVMRRIP
jgi:hypothetical protein